MIANIKESKVFISKDYYKQYIKLDSWIIQYKCYFAFIGLDIFKEKKVIFMIDYF